MVNLFPIKKQQEHPIFGRFNTRYGDIIVEYCPPLNKFQIDILTVEEFRNNPGEPPGVLAVTGLFAIFVANTASYMQ